jgi:hypothetical protein
LKNFTFQIKKFTMKILTLVVSYTMQITLNLWKELEVML